MDGDGSQFPVKWWIGWMSGAHLWPRPPWSILQTDNFRIFIQWIDGAVTHIQWFKVYGRASLTYPSKGGPTFVDHG